MKTLLLLLLSGLAHGQCITNIAAEPTATGAQVTWTTCTPATSQVKYGKTTSYGGLTTLDNTLVTSHSQAITGLLSNTLYHYIVKSHNATNTYSSQDHTFTTTSGSTSHTATLDWQPSPDTNVTAYNTYRSTVQGGPYPLLSTSLGPCCTYVDNTVTNGTTYYYVVQGVYPSGMETAPSNEAAAVIP